jgi:hypothetical protein
MMKQVAALSLLFLFCSRNSAFSNRGLLRSKRNFAGFQFRQPSYHFSIAQITSDDRKTDFDQKINSHFKYGIESEMMQLIVSAADLHSRPLQL